MKNFLSAFGLFLALGLLLYLLPNSHTPLHSEVTWEPRMETATDSRILDFIPDWMKLVGTYPQSSINICRDWYQFTGRLNCLDTLSLKWTASVAGSNADLWRLIYIIILAVDVALFYLICSKLKISKPIILFLAIGLYFWPVEVWMTYITAEPRAVLFLLISYILVLSSKSVWFSALSAISMIGAVLTKETFVFAWFLIPALIFWQTRKPKSAFALILPHIVSLSFVIAYGFLAVNILRVKTPGYVFATLSDDFSIINYLLANLPRLLPVYLFNNWVFVLIFLAFFLVAMKLSRKKLLFAVSGKLIFLWLSILITALLVELPYMLTNRALLGRYIVPANFLISILIGLVATNYYGTFKFRKRILRNLLFLSLVFLIFFPSLISVISQSTKDRADAESWNNLVSKVIIAPVNSHVVVELEESSMVETAFSLEANSLLAKRYDLVFHANLLNSGDVNCASFNCYNVQLFNLNRTPISNDANIIHVKVTGAPRSFSLE